MAAVASIVSQYSGTRTPSALMRVRVRKTLYYVIDIDQFRIPCPKRQIKNSPIFNPTRLQTESPNFLHANISAFTVVSYVHTKHNIDSLAVTILSMHNHFFFFLSIIIYAICKGCTFSTMLI